MIGIYGEIVINENETIIIDKSNIISVSTSIFIHEENAIASYGIISNGGNISFKDMNKDVLGYANEGLLVEGLDCTIKIYDSLSKSEITASVLKTNQWDYDSYTNEVSVSLKDDLEEWQNIQVEGFEYDPRNKYSVLRDGNMENLYNWLHERTPSKYKMLTFNELDDKTKNVLRNTIIGYPLLRDGSLWQQWDKVCKTCCLHIYKNSEGKTICSYTYGS